MGYIQLLIAILTLGREIIKYLNNLEKSKSGKAKKMADFKNALKKARKEGNTDELENIFADLVNGANGKLQNNG